MLSDIRRRQGSSAERGEQRRHAAQEWPPTPGDLSRDLPAGLFAPAMGTDPFASEDEERAALHRLVFSQDAAAGGGRARGRGRGEPRSPAVPDRSGPGMPAEDSSAHNLPMYYIRQGAQDEEGLGGGDGHVSGISGWGAGYMPLPP